MGKTYDEYERLVAKIEEYDSHSKAQSVLYKFFLWDDGIQANYRSLIGKAWEVQDDWVGEDRTSFMNKIKEIREMLNEAVAEMTEGIKLTVDKWNDERSALIDEKFELMEEFGIVDNIRYEIDNWEW